MFSTATKEPVSRKEGIRDHLEEARRNGKAAVDDLDSAAHEMGKDVRNFIETAIDSASEGLAQTKEKITDTADSLAQRVRINPLTSTAIAVGVGIFLGALFRRR